MTNKRRNKMPQFTPEEQARNLTSLAHRMNMPDLRVEFRKSWGDLYRVSERSGQFAFFSNYADAAANVIAKARARNASKVYRTGERNVQSNG